MDSLSIVIPCYNPQSYLHEAIASARAQTGVRPEIILVNDGTAAPEGLDVLRTAAASVDHYLVQSNRGLAAARNTGFRAASHPWVIPLDADDTLRPEFAITCAEALRTNPASAFAYGDYEVFGSESYVERLPGYNLYRLLHRNTLTYAALIRKEDWTLVGGYDESMTRGYEDWEFWLNLASHGRFGHHIGHPLFRYRKHGPSLFDIAKAHHSELAGYIRAKHARMYTQPELTRIKAYWDPAVCIVGSELQTGRQSLQDYERFDADAAGTASRSATFLLAGGTQRLDSESAELAALAVWSGSTSVSLPDGSVALSRKIFLSGLAPNPRPPVRPPLPALPGVLETLRRHLANAELLSLDSWIRYPLRSAMRLIPLALKQRVNRFAGREVFDLTFYLRFQPKSVVVAGELGVPLLYLPAPRTRRRRLGLITPHLGPGGAERVMLEIARSQDRADCEIFLIAAQSGDTRWLSEWRMAVDHVYDLEAVIRLERRASAIYSILANWRPDAVLFQNTLLAYSIMPHLKQNLPSIRVLDLIHATGGEWDISAATAGVASAIDLRVVVSEAARRKLLDQGIAEHKIRLIRNGVDLERFHPGETAASGGARRVLFAGRLDPAKRPHLLVDIASALRSRHGAIDFCFVVAGDGPQSQSLARRVRRAGLESVFLLRGHVADLAPELAACDLLVVPSEIEGVPLAVLEAFASSKPVVASAVGSVPELVGPDTGFLVPRDSSEVARFADAIATLLEQPQLRRKLGSNGRRLVESGYSLERARSSYRELFAENPPEPHARV